VTASRAISADWEVARGVLLAKIKQIGAAGVDWIQIREKHLGARQLAEFASEVLRSVPATCRVILNDRLDIAWAVRAGGVHLGENSLAVKDARTFLSEREGQREFRVGASVHSLEAAREAEKADADYVVFGPVFATPSKAKYGLPQGLERLREVSRSVATPVLAIGGITVDNARPCFENGARGIAAIRLFQDAAVPGTIVDSLL
jgi:thiamine-phosphate diphosphorylase